MNRKVGRALKLVCFLLLLLFLLLVILLSLRIGLHENNQFLETYDNVTGAPFKIVPNTVHFVIFSATTLNFITFLSLVAAIKIQQSNIWIHCDCNQLTGYYWTLVEALSSVTNVPVKVSFLRRPTHVYGQPLSSVYHASDIARIQVLIESGGIYLDTDMILLKPLDRFLHYEMVVGWPYTEYFGNQIMIGHPKARFLKKYLESYKRYLPREWYYNGGQVPTEQILTQEPHLVHRVPELFGVHNLVDRLYSSDKWDRWRQYYAVHLLSRHHSDPERLNETTVLSYHRPFGEIARYILYDRKPWLDVARETWIP